MKKTIAIFTLFCLISVPSYASYKRWVPGLDQSSTNTFTTVDASTGGVTGVLPVANGGTEASTAQQGLNNITNVVSATDEYVLTKDTASGNAIFKAAPAGSFSDSGTTVYLTDTTDEVVFGGVSPLSSAKFSIDGDFDQPQLLVQSNATQTTSPFIVEKSDGTDILNLTDGGNMTVAGSGAATITLGSSTTVTMTESGGSLAIGGSATASQFSGDNGGYIKFDNATNIEIGSVGFENYCIDPESTLNTIIFSDCNSSGVTSFIYSGIGLQIGKNGATNKPLTFYNELGATDYSTTFQSSASQTASVTYTLPTAVAGSNGLALVSTTGGVLSWAAPGATPAGAGTEVQYRASSTALGAITNTSTDGTTLSMTSPKVVTGINDANGNELLKVTATGSAVNELTLANGATGNNPTLTASTSGDTNVGINLTTLGTGGVVITTSATPTQSLITSGLVVNNGGANNSADGFIAKGNAVTLLQTDPTTNTVSKMGQITNYNNIATVSNGVPSEYATVDLTGQTAAKTATTLYTPTATGLYRISIYEQVTTAAQTSSILGGATGTVITYNDGDGNVAQSDTVAMDSTTGTIVTTAAGNTTATNLIGVIVIYARTGVAIQYAIGYTSVGSPAMAYAVHIKCEAL